MLERQDERLLRRLWPDKVGAKPLIDRTAVGRLRRAAGRIIKGMISGGHAVRVVPHQIRHDHPDATLLVVEHNRRATGRTRAQFERTVRVSIVEGLAVQSIGVFNSNVAMFEEYHVRRVLTGHALANGAVADVIVDWIIVGVRMNMVAPTRILFSHVFLP